MKVCAALAGFRQSFPKLTFEALGISAESGVSDQPASDSKTRLGAVNRAAAARAQNPDADFWVGIEGGIEAIADEMLAFAWVVIHSADQTGQSRSGAFLLPPQVQALIRAGKELGDANDIVFAKHNSKQQGGAIGLLTGDVIGRHVIKMHRHFVALVPFISSELFRADTRSNASVNWFDQRISGEWIDGRMPPEKFS